MTQRGSMPGKRWHMERRLQCQHDCWRFLTCEERTCAFQAPRAPSVSFASLGKTTKETDSSRLSSCQPHGVCGLGNLLQNGSRSKTFVPFSSEPLHRRKTYDMKGEFASNAHRPHEAYEEAASINFSPSKPRSSHEPFLRQKEQHARTIVA